MLNVPVKGKKYTGNYHTTKLTGLQLSDDYLPNTEPALPLLSSILWSCCLPFICIFPLATKHNSTHFSSCRVTLRLGGNWRSTVRHILRWVSFIDLLIHVIFKHLSCHHHKQRYHTRSSQMHTTHKWISPEGSEYECILHCLVYISSGPA